MVPNNLQIDIQLTKGADRDSITEADTKKKTLYDATSRSQYYRTHAGHWKQRDEPDEEEQYRQADQINQVLKAQRQKASRERLKRKPGGVPVRKDGRRLFEDFMAEATKCRASGPRDLLIRNGSDDLKNAYNAASSLEFEQWVVFMDDLFKSKI